MRWRDLRRSTNVTDARGRRAGLGMPIPVGRGGLGLVVILILVAVFGGPQAVEMLLSGGGGMPVESTSRPSQPLQDEAGQFVAAILGSTEDVWGRVFAASGERYAPPRLTLFEQAVNSACGFASAATGPFYCPADQRVYLDTSFFAELARMGGPGDFAAAYVIGHEVGHHVQTLLGTSSEVRSAQGSVDRTAANRLQVAMELQADCYAGVWAYHANQQSRVLEPGDVEEGLAAAAAIGDDRLQRSAGRRVTPESFTHGSSAARRQWLESGLTHGNPAECDTFGTR